MSITGIKKPQLPPYNSPTLKELHSAMQVAEELYWNLTTHYVFNSNGFRTEHKEDRTYRTIYETMKATLQEAEKKQQQTPPRESDVSGWANL